MAKKPANSGKEWTGTDDKKLKKLAKQKLPLEDIAKKLQRTQAATRQRAAVKKVSLKPNN